MKVREIMAYINKSATVKLEYTEVTYGIPRPYKKGPDIKHRDILVPSIDATPDPCFLYPFKNKEELYDIDINMIDVGSDMDEGIIYLIMDYIVSVGTKE